MDLLNLRDSVYYASKVLQIFSIWYKKTNYLAKSYNIITKILLIIYIVSHNLYMIQSDLETIMHTAYLTITVNHCCFKFFYFNMEKVQHLMSYFDETLFLPNSPYQVKILNKTVVFSRRLGFVYSACVVITWFLLAFVSYQQDGMSAHLLVPKYILDNFYWVCFWFSFWFTGAVGMTAQAVDSVTVMFMVHIGAQCDLLADNVERLVRGVQDPQIELRRCIAHHKLILKWSKEFSQIFHNMLLCQFAESVIVYCLMMYNLANMEFGWEYMQQAFFTISVCVEPFLYCWFGTKLTLKSEAIAYKLYCSEWYKASTRFKKDFIFFMQRLQTPIVIYVGKVFPASVLVWVTITKSAWSYFLMLMQMNARRA